MEIVAADIGGTHARFALAQIGTGTIRVGRETVLKTSDYAGLSEAWRAYRQLNGGSLPSAAGIAIAAPLVGDEVRMTNNSWVIRQSQIAGELGLDHLTFLNDFAAVAQAISACGEDELSHLCGPSLALPPCGVVSIVGPGTGFGVAILDRNPAGDRVIATEGSHIGFSPRDDVEDQLLAQLRGRFGRVSVERVVAGAGLAEIHAVLSGATGEDDQELWRRALSGDDPAAAASLSRFCAILGSVTGDFALAHGAHAVVVAGGLGLRLAAHLPTSDFAERFVDKGRYRPQMLGLPVKLLMHPQPGLLGAAAAFAAEHIKEGPRSRG